MNSSSRDDADFSTAQSNALNGSSEDLGRQAAMAVVTAQQKLSVQSNVYGKPSADTKQMAEDPDARLQILVKPKHSNLQKSTYEKEQTKQANKKKREQQKEENIRVTKANYTEAIQNPACVLGIHLCECLSSATSEKWLNRCCCAEENSRLR